jgi:DNA-binding SARP family transcriptional activator
MPPPGRPAALVKLLAVRGAAVPVDEAIELLWPEIDDEVGRARLRNVLSRIRAACGDLVVRTDGGLRLAAGSHVDATEFERTAREALAASRRNGPEAEPLVRQALARYAGELLPEDRYERFAAAPRERLADLRLALLDRLATAAAGRGDVDEALRALDEAIAAQPLDEHRYVTAADLALRLGRAHRAAAYVTRGLEVTAELGVEPTPELDAIRRRIHVR